MVKSNVRQITADEWSGRLQKARRYRQSSEKLAEFGDGEEDADLITVGVVQAAIAYGDALAARFGEIQNKGDHRGLVKAIRQALGKQADAVQMTRLSDLLSAKSESEYGHKAIKLDEALRYLEKLQRVSDWAESLLRT